MIQVIVPTYARAEKMKVLLDSFSNNNFPQHDYLLTVIENGSDVSRNIVESYKERIPLVFQQTDIGNKSVALNLVMEGFADDDFVLFLDDDIILEKTVLSSYAAAIGEYGPGHVYGGEVYPLYEEEPNPEVLPHLPLSSTGQYFESAGKDETPGYQFLGCNWGAYMKNLRVAGGFDAGVGPGAASGARGQETDMQYRLAAIGCIPVRVARAGVHHYVPARTLTRKWVLDRAEKSSMWHGAQISNRAGLIRHVIRWAAFGLLGLTGNFTSQVRYRRHKGVVRGFWGKSNRKIRS